MPLDSGTFHCFKNFESGQGTVYCKTSLNEIRISQSGECSCIYVRLFPFVIILFSYSLSAVHFSIPGRRQCKSNLP